MMDVVYIDEKWFYLNRVKITYFLLSDEEPSHRAVQSKQHMIEVMYLGEVARPTKVFD